jgi:hypothetical protein
MDKTKIIFTDSLSVPKIIGIGPIMTTPPPLTLPFSLLAFFKKSRIIAIITIAKPTKTKVEPMLHSNCSLISVAAQENFFAIRFK